MIHMNKKIIKAIAISVLLAIMLVSVFPTSFSYANTAVEKDSLRVEIITNNSKPYLAGSTISFDIKVTNLSANKVKKNTLALNPSIDNPIISSANSSALQTLLQPEDLDPGKTWKESIDLYLNRDLSDLSTALNVELTKNNVKVLASETIDVKALEGILVKNCEEIRSVFSDDGFVQLAYTLANYDKQEENYTYSIEVNGNIISNTNVEWIKEPTKKISFRKSETVEFKIPTNLLNPDENIYNIKFIAVMDDGRKSSRTVKVQRQDVADIADIISSLPDGIGLEHLYYDNVKNDPTAPFHNEAELRYLLENSSIDYAKKIWNMYQYDLWDPNFYDRGGCKPLYLTEGTIKKPDYGDEKISTTGGVYPKDELSPFHSNPKAKVDSVECTLSDNGTLVNENEDHFINLSKSASPDKGDENKNREYTIDLKAMAKTKQVKPIAMVFQIQTSWQMFDLAHANDRASLVDGKKVNEELLSLYEMKQGFRDFARWMDEKSNGALIMGITNFQHNGSHSAINVSQGKTKRHFTNDGKEIEEAINGWDTFGDCEHIHYSSKALQEAAEELGVADNFLTWKDQNGSSIYDDAEIISVIIGGACEAADLKVGGRTLLDIPSSQYGKITKQYGISTNKGTIDKISWMDYEYQDGKFNSGKYYKGVTTREEFFETLKNLYTEAQGELYVPNVTISDTVTAEFEVERDNIRAYVDGKDVTGSVNITTDLNKDGTTSISCRYSSVKNNEEIHLQIPVIAKEDFIGGNNIKTNTGVPQISYPDLADSSITHVQEFVDNPTVNVPIKFDIIDGASKTVAPNTRISLEDMAYISDNMYITRHFEEVMKNYDQVAGTVKYQWYDKDGNPIGNATETVIDSTNRTCPEIPKYDFITNKDDLNHTLAYRLNITFEPEPLDSNSTNKVAVRALSRNGEVNIKVKSLIVAKVKVRKQIDNYNSNLVDEEFMISIRDLNNTVDKGVVLKHGKTSGEILLYDTAELIIEEIVPKNYSFVGLTLSGTGATQASVNGNRVVVNAGDDIEIVLHNKYRWLPYFSDYDAVKNSFIN